MLYRSICIIWTIQMVGMLFFPQECDIHMLLCVSHTRWCRVKGVHRPKPCQSSSLQYFLLSHCIDHTSNLLWKTYYKKSMDDCLGSTLQKQGQLTQFYMHKVELLQQTWVKSVIVFLSNSFLCFTELVWYFGTYEILSKSANPTLLVFLADSIAPGKINRAQRSIWIQNNYRYNA